MHALAAGKIVEGREAPLEGHQVVHVHIALLEGLARRKVEVARHLGPPPGTQTPSLHTPANVCGY